jgi:hypothetical protein
MTLQKKRKKYSPSEKFFVAPVFYFFEKEKPVKEKKKSNFHIIYISSRKTTKNTSPEKLFLFC